MAMYIEFFGVCREFKGLRNIALGKGVFIDISQDSNSNLQPVIAKKVANNSTNSLN